MYVARAVDVFSISWHLALEGIFNPHTMLSLTAGLHQKTSLIARLNRQGVHLG